MEIMPMTSPSCGWLKISSLPTRSSLRVFPRKLTRIMLARWLPSLDGVAPLGTNQVNDHDQYNQDNAR